MSFKQFSIQLIVVTGLVFLLLFAIGNFINHNMLDGFSLSTIAFFVILCPLLFIWGKSTAQSPDMNAFSRMALMSISLKMFLALTIVVLYAKKFEPPTKYFLVSFLIIYFAYTIFETYFLMQLSKETYKIKAES